MQFTPQQQKKLEKIKKLIDGGNVGIITYLLDLEEKLDQDLPTITDVISRLKGDKGDTYNLTDTDKEDIAKEARKLLNDEEIVSTLLSRLSLQEIAKIASSYIEVPKPKEVDTAKLKKQIVAEVLENIPPPLDGENGKDADVEAIIEEVEKDLEEDLPQYGTQFRDGLELLQGDERLDKKAIKGLDDYDEVVRLTKTKPTHFGGGGKQNLYQLNDVNITSPTNNQVLKYNSTTNLWENGTGGSGGLNSFTSPDNSITIGGSLTDPTVDINLSNANTWTALQSNENIFLNNSNIDWTAGAGNDVIIAAGGSSAGNWIGFLWDSTNSVVKLQDLNANLYDLQVDTLTAIDAIIATTISATTGVFSTLRATGSGDMLFESNSGTDVALFGAGGGAGATFYGGVNINGTTRLATSLNGALSASSGTVSAGTLSIANGGTNATSYGANRLIFMNSGNTAFSSDAGLTFNGTNFAVDTNVFYTDATNNTIGFGTTRSGAISSTNPRVRIFASSSSSTTSSFEIMNASFVSRLLFRDDGRLWVGDGTVSYGEIVNITTSGVQAGLVIQTTGTGYAAVDGFRLQVVDGTGVRYHNYETTPHIFYVNSSEVVRMQTGTGTDPVMLIKGTLAAQYSGAGSTRGGTISLISSAGTPQDWYMAVGGTDNTTVNGRSWFLYDNTNSVARFFVDTSSRVGVGLGNSAATSFVDITASTSSIAQLRLRAGVAVSSPNDGEIWYENTNDRLMFRKNTTTSEVVSASAVTTETVTSDTTLTITYNGVTYKLLAIA